MTRHPSCRRQAGAPPRHQPPGVLEHRRPHQRAREAASRAAADEILAAAPYQIGGAFARRQLSRWEIIKANLALILATP